MKQFFKLSLLLVISMVASCLFVSAQDTTLNISNVIDQGKQIVKAASGHNLTYNVFLFAAILGALGHIVYSTLKGVKNTKNGSPVQFIFSYWVKDNVLTKIVTIATFLFSFSLVVSLPTTLWAYIIAGVVGVIIGWLIDVISDQLKEILPQYKA